MVNLTAVFVLNVMQAIGAGPVADPIDFAALGRPNPVATPTVLLPDPIVAAVDPIETRRRRGPRVVRAGSIDERKSRTWSRETVRLAEPVATRKTPTGSASGDPPSEPNPTGSSSNPEPGGEASDPPIESTPDRPADPVLLHHRAYHEPTAANAMRAGGVRAYTIFYQTWDQQSLQSDRADPKAVIDRWRRMFPSDTTAFLQLDYEGEFLEAMRSDPSSERFQDMLSHLCEVFDEVKAAFPRSRLTFYGLPNISKFIKDDDGRQLAVWATANERERAVEMARFTAMRPLLDRLDWFVPNLYDWTRNATQAEKYGPETVDRDILWRTDLVRITKDYVLASDRPDRPVIPMVCVYYVFRGEQTGMDRGMLIPIDEFMHDQVMPAIEGGADGLAFWNNDENIVDTAFGVTAFGDEERVASRRRTVMDRNGGRPFDWSSQTARRSALDLFERQEALRLARALQAWRQAKDDEGKEAASKPRSRRPAMRGVSGKQKRVSIVRVRR